MPLLCWDWWRENGPWLFYRLPSYYKSIENGERSILEWAKTWKADAIIGQWKGAPSNKSAIFDCTAGGKAQVHT